MKTTEYDAAGRASEAAVTGGLGTAVPAVTTTYDATSGKVATITSADGGTFKKTYDKLGRLLSYTDADGGVTTSTYDAEGHPLQVNATRTTSSRNSFGYGLGTATSFQAASQQTRSGVT